MTWEVSTNGLSFEKYKKNYYSQLKKKKISLEKIDKDFSLKKKEGSELLSKCVNPNNKEVPIDLSTGLAIGLVQSGKTSSIELVANLARDNGFRLIIVMSGLVGTLTKQTQERLYQSMNGIQWKRIFIPGQHDQNLEIESTIKEILNAFNTWDDEIYNNDEKRTVIIVTMKNIPRLKKLSRILTKLREKMDLNNIPTLIIDDECDNASLNTRRDRNNDENDSDDEISQTKEFVRWNRDELTFDAFLNLHGLQESEILGLNNIKNIDELAPDQLIRIDDVSSATHKRIKILRKLLPLSSYIGYTATPYANLLINTWANLSPKFAQVLSPGDNYNGSDFFFNKHEDKYILPIYRQDLIDLEIGKYIPSLKLSLRIFILGVAYGILKEEHLSNNARSMFVHTASQVHQETGGYISHEYVVDLINEDIEWLKSQAKENRNFESFQEFVDSEFGEAHEKLTETIDKDSFIKLNKDNFEAIEKALNFIEVISFNASSSQGRSTIPIIKWYEEGYARILVGGHGLDRGYTVEGLTVSYLFRRASQNLDTTLQRARFFGYHAKYLNLLRIFLPDNSNTFFKSAAKTERYLREHLTKYLNDEKKLIQWPRIFIANSNTDFNLTSSRKIDLNIIRDPKYIQNSFDARMHLISNEGLRKNRDLLNELKNVSEPLININSPHTYLGNNFMKNHRIVRGKTLSNIKNYFSDEERFSEDGAFIFGLVNHFIDENFNPKQRDTFECPIILMNDKDYRTGRAFKRSINSKNQTITIQSNRTGEPYDKDAFVHWDYLMDTNYTSQNFAEQMPTLQVYNFEVHENDINDENFISDVPYFYFYAPKNWFGNMSLHIGDDR